MGGELEQTEELRNNQKEVISRRISFWLSFILAVGITYWYYASNTRTAIGVGPSRKIIPIL